MADKDLTATPSPSATTAPSAPTSAPTSNPAPSTPSHPATSNPTPGSTPPPKQGVSGVQQATDSKSAAVAGAQAVADAVRKVADAAVSAVHATELRASGPSDFVFVGSPGGKFRINGRNLGTGGVVRLNGVQLNTVGWGATNIEGTLPGGAQPGQVTVEIDSQTTQTGQYKG